ncbi:MAG: hypothetical protein KBS65_05835 [Prevotella sp.]|nr:hypothetical protein [Candidatus Equicola stercoris]
MRKIIVFDDDPTGIQTVQGCLLVTDWSKENLRTAFEDKEDFFYILTNTRAMTRDDAAATTESAMEAVLEEYGHFKKTHGMEDDRLVFISRSDSCLRGHFPLETDVMKDVLRKHDIKIWAKTPFCPAFIEAGRVTEEGIHYMIADGRKIPVSETEFAKDNVFGYHHSELHEYIKEKGGNADGYDIVNANCYQQLDDYAQRLLTDTEHFDGAVVIRSSSSLPKAMAHVPDQPLLEKDILENGTDNSCGVVIVGSHVKKTTGQLEELLKCDGTEGVEVDVEEILHTPESLRKEVTQRLSALNAQHITPVIYTSRKEVRLDDADKRQKMGQTISDFLVSIVQHLPFTPSYLIAKGGITSHDILCKGLKVKTARVLGQILSGVPCIMTDRFPYIIFPGNVGDKDALKEVFIKLR